MTNATTGSFNPSIHVPARRVNGHYFDAYVDTPPGWMWVLAFALRGVEWAILKADTQEFRDMVHKYLKEQKQEALTNSIEHHYAEIKRLKGELHIL